MVYTMNIEKSVSIRVLPLKTMSFYILCKHTIGYTRCQLIVGKKSTSKNEAFNCSQNVQNQKRPEEMCRISLESLLFNTNLLIAVRDLLVAYTGHMRQYKTFFLLMKGVTLFVVRAFHVVVSFFAR